MLHTTTQLLNLGHEELRTTNKCSLKNIHRGVEPMAKKI